MSYLRREFILVLFVMLVGCFPALAQDAKTSTDIKNKYQNIEIVSFEIKEGVKFPPEARDVVMAQISEELTQIKRFRKVSKVGEPITEAEGPTVRLVGSVIEYSPGSRAKRYLIGFGAGATKVKAHIQLVDIATGNVVFERDVDGKVWIGMFGGDSSGATRGLAKEVAKVTKKQLFKS
jgi:hypothetical protein